MNVELNTVAAPEFPITIYHNPKCGTSRNTLAMIRAAGYEPEVIEYVQTGWSRPQLISLPGPAMGHRHARYYGKKGMLR